MTFIYMFTRPSPDHEIFKNNFVSSPGLARGVVHKVVEIRMKRKSHLK